MLRNNPRHPFTRDVRTAAPRTSAWRQRVPALAALALTTLCAFPLYTAYAQIHTPIAPGSGGSVTPGTGGGATPVPPIIVATQRNDNTRDGVNYRETALYPPSGTAPATLPPGVPKSFGLVGQTTFGLLFTRTLDGPSYSQPLFYQNLGIVNPYTGKSLNTQRGHHHDQQQQRVLLRCRYHYGRERWTAVAR